MMTEARSYSDYTRWHEDYNWLFPPERMTYAEWAHIWSF